jgi:hypothetical protein
MPKIIKNDTYYELIDSRNHYERRTDELEIKLDEAQERVRLVEDNFKGRTGIQVRQDITKVYAKFTKLEMALMMAGVIKLSKDAKTPDDALFMIGLVKKIQGFLDHMDEEKEIKQ